MSVRDALSDVLLEHYLKTVLPSDFHRRSIFVRARFLVVLTPRPYRIAAAVRAAGLSERLAVTNDTGDLVTLEIRSPDNESPTSQEIMISRKRLGNATPA